ncbi:DUF3311 domain-containing protein [Natronococcus occultus]|uniref:DUF3311 domain-containing protein n=1 Tax=Natronococcus occultus SP4 TaxID=694430 RepID=L0K153_9EURY|nr:DUF3311 domain-containing protein [Natronococcus occultus]AGB37833.1 Protein of unknown function (DUF3311) [Natronococcus occultus SP4]
MARLALWGWIAVAIGLSALTIPWFLWGDGTVVAGVPLWLWWHVGWMGVASLVFWLFARHAWGLGIETGEDASGGDTSGGTSSSASADAGGERR